MDNYLNFSKEEAKTWLEFVYPLTIVKDRYGGCYSSGRYVAYPCEFYEVDEAVGGEDGECMAFWDEFQGVVGRGGRADEAVFRLIAEMKNIAEQ